MLRSVKIQTVVNSVALESKTVVSRSQSSYSAHLISDCGGSGGVHLLAWSTALAVNAIIEELCGGERKRRRERRREGGERAEGEIILSNVFYNA